MRRVLGSIERIDLSRLLATDTHAIPVRLSRVHFADSGCVVDEKARLSHDDRRDCYDPDVHSATGVLPNAWFRDRVVRVRPVDASRRLWSLVRQVSFRRGIRDRVVDCMRSIGRSTDRSIHDGPHDLACSSNVRWASCHWRHRRRRSRSRDTQSPNRKKDRALPAVGAPHSGE